LALTLSQITWDVGSGYACVVSSLKRERGWENRIGIGTGPDRYCLRTQAVIASLQSRITASKVVVSRVFLLVYSEYIENSVALKVVCPKQVLTCMKVETRWNKDRGLTHSVV
jgi:hypothetical protein